MGIFAGGRQQEFICAEELSTEDLGRHINEQESIALRNSVEVPCINFPEIIRVGRVLCKIDSKVLFDKYNNQGSTTNGFITDI